MTGRPAFQVIEGGLPPQQEWTATDIRRICFPSVKELPFVKLKPDAEPMWHPESFWNVEPSGNWARDYALGRSYARQAVAAMRADGANLLGHIMDDMIADGIRREKLRGRRRRSPAKGGFLFELGRLLLPPLP